ncbi:hypothetical protein BCR42DRAFT_416090 [Absidia repens]|uniref:Uncharacterized protein n=1 Tax=Absidia repens TaxID=90262 RepID=A0A1X2IG30_9FUNG|nr:hypothetical protein BCR42DRAFT_416090 [Absidia repens]
MAVFVSLSSILMLDGVKLLLLPLVVLALKTLPVGLIPEDEGVEGVVFPALLELLVRLLATELAAAARIDDGVVLIVGVLLLLVFLFT